MYQQQPQLQGVADLLANQGRYGDSMLVHMNPVEVQGLASMSPTGSLTVNPQTGQPEAFLPFLAPLLGGMIGSSALTGATLGGLIGGAGLSSAAAGAIGSGLATAVAEGDLKKGIISGITGFGIGSALGKLGSAGIEAGTSTALQEGAKDITADQIAQVTKDLSGGAVDTGMGTAVVEGLNPTLASSTLSGVEQAALGDALGKNVGPSLGEVFSGEGFKALTSPTALIPAAIGEGTNLQIAQDEMAKKMAKDLRREKGADYERGIAMREANVFDPNITPEPYATSPAYGSSYSQLANAGGIVSLDPNDFRRRFNGLIEMGAPVVGMQDGGAAYNFNPYNPNIGMGPNDPRPAGRQAALRNKFVISPEQLQQTYQDQGLPGFGPEIMYFTQERGVNPNPFEDWRPSSETPPPSDGGDGGYSPPPAGDNPYNVADSSEEVQQAYSYGAPKDASASELAAYNLGAKDIDGDGRLTTEEFRQWEGYDSWAEQQGGRWGISGSTHPGGIAGSRFTGQRDSRGNEIYVMPDGATVTVDTFDDWAASSGIATYGSAPNGYRYTEADFNNFIKSGGIDANENNKIDPAEREAHKALLGGGTGGITEEVASEEATTTNVLDGIDLSSLNLTPEQIASIGDTLADLQQTNYANYMNFGRNFGMQEGGETQIQSEADRLIDLAQMAVLGRLPEEEADVVIQAFIDEFGEEAFQALRDSTLEDVVPGSQKEGEIVGAGGGMDDLIPGMIGDQQPVAVSPGEYIVPADVVSGIGDGSTDAGVQELDGMLDRVRMERTGTTQQPAPLAKGGMLPR